MERRVLGRTGLAVGVLGFGGYEIGSHKLGQQTAAQLLNAALDAGLNVIDTAECYLTSEELIGATVAHRRREYHLFTKVGHAAGQPYQDWDPQLILPSIERSLKRLRTDRVELVQLHSCGVDVLERGEVIAELRKARDQGKCRFIGYSGDSASARWAVDSGVFDTLQTSVSIADQESISLLLPAAGAAGMGVIAKRPIANAIWRSPRRPEDGYYQPYYDRLQALGYDFLADPERAVETALRFTLGLDGVHTAIVGTANPSRWAANARLIDKGPLPQAMVDAIRARWAEVAKADWVGQI